MLHKFNVLFFVSYLNYKIMSISSFSSSSTVQNTINNLSTYVYKHFAFDQCIFWQNHYRRFAQISPGILIDPVKKLHFIQTLSIVLPFFKPGTRRPQAGVHLVSWNCSCVDVCMCVCVCVCVCPPPRLLITSGMIWTPYDWLNKFYSRYMEIVVIIVNGHGLGIDTRHSH